GRARSRTRMGQRRSRSSLGRRDRGAPPVERASGGDLSAAPLAHHPGVDRGRAARPSPLPALRRAEGPAAPTGGVDGGVGGPLVAGPEGDGRQGRLASAVSALIAAANRRWLVAPEERREGRFVAGLEKVVDEVVAVRT